MKKDKDGGKVTAWECFPQPIIHGGEPHPGCVTPLLSMCPLSPWLQDNPPKLVLGDQVDLARYYLSVFIFGEQKPLLGGFLLDFSLLQGKKTDKITVRCLLKGDVLMISVGLFFVHQVMSYHREGSPV